MNNIEPNSIAKSGDDCVDIGLIAASVGDTSDDGVDLNDAIGLPVEKTSWDIYNETRRNLMESDRKCYVYCLYAWDMIPWVYNGLIGMISLCVGLMVMFHQIIVVMSPEYALQEGFKYGFVTLVASTFLNGVLLHFGSVYNPELGVWHHNTLHPVAICHVIIFFIALIVSVTGVFGVFECLYENNDKVCTMLEMITDDNVKMG